MKITMLGTAAIGYPLTFCNCENCKQARIHKGKSIRKRASILINDDLTKIIDLINISNKTIKIVKQNLFWAFFYNICMIPIATGLLKGLSLNPIIASIAMTLSSITVILNSLRLKENNL